MSQSATANATTTDPVCGMSIAPTRAAASSTFEGETISFCSQSCKTTFDAAPEQYRQPVEPAPGACCGPSCCATK